MTDFFRRRPARYREAMSDSVPHARDIIFGEQQERILARLHALDPDLARDIQSFAYDTVYDRPGLDLKTKELIACALLVSLGSPPERKHRYRQRGASDWSAICDQSRMQQPWTQSTKR